MNNVTMVFGYYNQPVMLDEQIRNMESYPVEIRKLWHVVVVDDGSQSAPLGLLRIPNLCLRAFRVDVDIPWNNEGVRNIGVKESKTPWLLVTDIDHIVPVETAESLVSQPHREDQFYGFKRRWRHNMEDMKPHPNTWFMSRKFWDRVGGCDERWSGTYGGDGEWSSRADKINQRQMLDLWLYHANIDEIPDAWVDMTRRYAGDGSQRAAIRDSISKNPQTITGRLQYRQIL